MKASSMKFHRSQRGAAALVVALVLVFGMSLVAFFANRGLIFEQKTSANQYRSTRAFEMAEAGLEWAMARLNDDIFMAASPSCTTGAGTQNFRDRYLAPTFTPPQFNFPVNAADRPRPGCSIAANGTTTCSCPVSGTNPTLGAATDPRFTVQFNPDPGGDPLTVEIVSYGCTNQGAPCDPGSTAAPDGTAVVSALFRVRPTFPNAPGAGLIAGSMAVTGGNLKVVNLDVKSNGITINSGTTVDQGNATSVVTLPGTPPRASVLDNDPALNALTNADSNGDLFFQSFFGETQAQYQANPQTWLITSGSCGTRVRCTSCGTANSCGSAVSAAYNQGATHFWADSNVQFTSSNIPTVGTLGTATRPIIFAGPAGVEMKANITAYGMFYVATATASENWDYDGSGTAKIYGSFVSRGNFDKGSGTLDLIYDASIFGNGQATGLMVRVPGSWRDQALPY
jgi:PilX N-terminal